MSQRHVSEMELPEIFERNERRFDARFEEEEWPEGVETREQQWELQTLAELERDARDARAAARDLRISLRAQRDPGRIASEMKRRSDYLRSRPMRGGFHKYELEMLAELDVLEAIARTLDLQRQRNAIGESELAQEMEVLSLCVVAVRGRYADLLAALGEPWPSRVMPEPEARRRELEEIEQFVARKRERDAA